METLKTSETSQIWLKGSDALYMEVHLKSVIETLSYCINSSEYVKYRVSWPLCFKRKSTIGVNHPFAFVLYQKLYLYLYLFILFFIYLSCKKPTVEKVTTEKFKSQYSWKEIQQRDFRRWWVTVSAAGITARRPLVPQPAYLPGFLSRLRQVWATAEAREGHREHGLPLLPLFFWKWALMMWCRLLLLLLLRWRANTPSNSNFLEQASPPAAPDYSSLVVAAERQPTPRRPPDSHIVPCVSGAPHRHGETAAARSLFNLSPPD